MCIEISASLIFEYTNELGNDENIFAVNLINAILQRSSLIHRG